MAKVLHWDRHLEADRLEFAKFLEPVVIAAWPSPVMRQKHFSRAEALVYMLTLEDVPRDVLALAVTKLVQDGITWMPKPGDIKAACCDIVDQRRLVAARQAKALQESCDCSEGWRDTDKGVVRCSCHQRALELIQQAGQPLTRPALTASTEPEVLA